MWLHGLIVALASAVAISPALFGPAAAETFKDGIIAPLPGSGAAWEMAYWLRDTQKFRQESDEIYTIFPRGAERSKQLASSFREASSR